MEGIKVSNPTVFYTKIFHNGEEIDLSKINRKSGIYFIIINGEKYIGSSKNLKQRILAHNCQLLGGRHNNVKLQRHYDKYKNLYFEIALFVEPENLLDVEQGLIDSESLGNLLNLSNTVAYGNGSCKAVYKIALLTPNIVEEYQSMTDAAKSCNVGFSRISVVANKPHKTCCGYRWATKESWETIKDDFNWYPGKRSKKIFAISLSSSKIIVEFARIVDAGIFVDSKDKKIPSHVIDNPRYTYKGFRWCLASSYTKLKEDFEYIDCETKLKT